MASSLDPSSQQKLQALSDEYQKIQTDLQSSVSVRQKLVAQQQENLSVQKEFNNLSEDSSIYKLVGPVLHKQDRTEALSAVDGRLEYIGGELKRTEAQIKSLEDNSQKKMSEIYTLRNQLQQQQ